jgi:dihydrofolate reductase
VPEDLKHFKRTTSRHAVIMGRRTHDDIGIELPGRRNIVLSRMQRACSCGSEFVLTLDDAIAAARETDAEPFVIGGADVYRQALPLATKIYLTHIEDDSDGDTLFPELDPHEWRLTHGVELSPKALATVLERTFDGGGDD